jgi:hypothetical protein
VGVALANLCFVVTFVVLLADPVAMMIGEMTALRVALALPMVGAALTVAAAAMAIRQWQQMSGTQWARIRYGAVVAIAVLFLWSLNTWNLLGWRL